MTVGELQKTLSKIKDKSLKVVISLGDEVNAIEIFNGIEVGHYHEGMALFTPADEQNKVNAIKLDCKEKKK